MAPHQPIYGPHPVERSMEQLREDCLNDFPESTQRPLIMEGVETCHSQIKAAALTGVMWVSGEFVTADPEPDTAMVLLTVPASVQATAKQTVTMEWLRSEQTTEYYCDTYCLHEVPQADEAFALYRETEEAIREEFGTQPDGEPRGYAIIPL